MPALSEYSNVYNSIILLLEAKGFQVWFDPKAELYFAERAGWDFASPTPAGLLGIVALFEARSPEAPTEYWWRIEGPDRYGSLAPTPTQPYDPVIRRRRNG